MYKHLVDKVEETKDVLGVNYLDNFWYDSEGNLEEIFIMVWSKRIRELLETSVKINIQVVNINQLLPKSIDVTSKFVVFVSVLII